MRLDIFIVVFFSHDIAFQSSFAEVFMFVNKHNFKKGREIRILESFMGILTSHSGFTYRLVK